MQHKKGNKSISSGGIRRSVSLQDAYGRQTISNGARNLALEGQNRQQNASWGTGPAASRLPTATQVLMQESRRASNGTIPGQQVPNNYPKLNGHVRHTHTAHDVGAASVMGSQLNSIKNDANEVRAVGLGSRPSRRVRGSRRQRSRIYDGPAVVAGYNSVPLIELDRLPRGGISLETKAVGRIQFGIPPETVKDSMNLGFEVPSVYIVPVERFCREMGPALGINLAEFEFPAYFNFFVRSKRCTLLVDSLDAERNIRRVFGETLLGPGQFRDHSNPKPNEDEDFDPSFPKDARPNFYKEFYHFRTAEKATNYQEHTIDTLLEFCHFKSSHQGRGAAVAHDRIGVPPTPSNMLHARREDETRADDRLRNRYACFNSGSCSDDRVSMDDTCEVLLTGDGECSGSVGENDDDLSEAPSLRRTFSDPDVRKTSLEDLMPPSCTHSYSIEGTSTETSARRALRRGSMDSTASFISGVRSRDGMSWASGASFMLASDDEDDPKLTTWMYSQAKWLSEVATVYPSDATADQKATNSCARVEVFKMAGGTEYIVHDVDKNNVIIGKAKFKGTVRVPDEIAVEGFLRKNPSRHDDDEDEDEEEEEDGHDDGGQDYDNPAMRSQSGGSVSRPITPPTFHPPSFGVTVLGNSHGFDKNGSVSGYVLWINGRGVMIDPPPYSSATLEREGIRPQMIMAIIITHCHADHDAGTFQKVMTGSRVAIITTPTIYKSFIRKYAALSGLSPTLLRHSHRHRPAIIGQPLKFQGATFNFTYTLHTIPCIAFKVEWRGRSMVFTGDHLNKPPVIDSLENQGVLTVERANDLRKLPLQDCDVLLHEAGPPPIHTPLEVLMELPERVKKRLFVVHTSALPKDCGLRVAPAGTAGTIRLDELHTTMQQVQLSSSRASLQPLKIKNLGVNGTTHMKLPNGAKDSFHNHSGDNYSDVDSITSMDRPGHSSHTVSKEIYGAASLVAVEDDYYGGNFTGFRGKRNGHQRIPRFGPGKLPPLVFLRPTCVSDAWFILNLLSNVPFLSSLSYSNTMEVLEIAQVEMFCLNEIVIPAHRRSELLCVVWEGTCVERDPVDGIPSTVSREVTEEHLQDLDLEQVLSLEGDTMLRQCNPTVWHAGDWTGPVALQPDLDRSAEMHISDGPKDVVALSVEGVKVIILNMKDLHQILKSGSKLFRKYLALKEKQAAEEAAMKAQMLRNEGDLHYAESLSFGDAHRIEPASENMPNHWYAYDSILEVLKCNSALGKLTALQKRHLESLAEGPRYFEAGHYLWQVGEQVEYAFLIVAGTATFAQKAEDEVWRNRRGSTGNMAPTVQGRPRLENLPMVEEDKQLVSTPNSEYARLEIGLQLRVEEMELDVYDQAKELLPKEERMRNARDRFANKVLARLYSRRAYTSELVFSRGHLLSDTSRMVSGNLAHIHHPSRQDSIGSMSHGLAGDHHCHTSNMVAGPDGCVVMVFPRPSLVQFLDGNPGVLLSLLGTQVVV